MNNVGVHVSLLLPTRGRPALVQRLFDSLIQTTSDLQRLEIVLYIDEDDAETREISHPVLSLVKIIGRPGETMGNMNRACYEASRGRYVMLINDDAIFRTTSWDARVIQSVKRFPDEIALVYGNDLDQGEAVPTFPIVSRRVCELLGEICPSGYRHLHIESHLLDIFRQLSRLGHKRICYMEDVIFDHMHYAVGKSALDTTYVKKNQRLDDLLFIALDEERAFAAKILARSIEVSDSEHSTEAKTEHPAVPAEQVDQKLGFVARIKRMLFST